MLILEVHVVDNECASGFALFVVLVKVKMLGHHVQVGSFVFPELHFCYKPTIFIL